MVVSKPDWRGKMAAKRSLVWPGRVILTAAFCMVGMAPAAWGQGRDRATGLLVSVPNPIDERAVTLIRNQIEEAVRANRGDRPRIKTIVFDFNPVAAKAATPDLHICLKLADYIVEVRNRPGGVRTVAFVHGEVTRHAVLPVLACNDLIMGTDAVIGDVRGDPPELIDPTMKFAYEKYAGIKSPGSPDLVLKMLVKDMEVWQSKTSNPVRYKDRLKIPEAERGRYKPVDLAALQRGSTRYTGEEALRVDLCRSNFSTLKEVADIEGLSESSLRQGILPGPKNAWLVEFSGAVTNARVSSVRRKIDKAIRRGANLIILQLDCEGGDPLVAYEFADKYLRNLRNDLNTDKVETVAYIPPGRKLEAATAIALGCTEIIMGKESALCSFNVKAEAPKGNGQQDVADDYAMLRKPLVELAEKQKYSPELIRATLDPNLVLVLVRSKQNPNNHFLVTEEKYKEDGNKNYLLVKTEKQRGQFLILDARKAYEYGIARVNPEEVDDIGAVYKHYSLDPDKIQTARADMLDDIEEFFRQPIVQFGLVIIGIIGLILEMKMPGLGFPGVVAAVCFVLYFWANASVGEFWWLAVMLFVLGLLLIGLEIFFLPGMAVFGISGVVLVVGSLVLVTLDKAPATTRDWLDLGKTLTMYTLSLVAAIVGAFFIARYLPQIPYANRLMLMPPPAEEPGQPAGGKPAGSEASLALLGAIGEAATNLRPAGKARFGEDFLDVVAEGSYVNAGQRVQVIEIEGNRIVVKEI
jgi:membrane-bound ClpP family serine protease